MRTLHIIESTFGGPRRYLGDLIRELRPSDGPFALVYARRRSDLGWGAVVDAALERDYETHELDFGPRWSFPNDWHCAVTLRNLITEYGPEIIHMHNRRAAALTALALFGMKRRPRLVFSPYTFAHKLGHGDRTIDRAAMRFVDRVIAVHESERARLSALHIVSPSRISLLEPSIDPDYFAPSAREAARAQLAVTGLPLAIGTAPLVVGLGAMEPYKDPLLFLSIIERVRARIPKVRAIWVGDGELRTEFERTVALRDLGAAVHVAGHKEDVRPFIAAADVVLSAAHFLPFGYSILESLAMERPVIALGGPGPSDILRDAPDILSFPGADPAGAAERLGRLLYSRESAASIARAGRSWVLKRYALSSLRERALAAYSEVFSAG